MSLWHPMRLGQILAYDDTRVSAETTEKERKYARISTKGAGIGFSALRVVVSLWTDDPSHTAYVRIYIDDETDPRAEFTSNSTTEEVKEKIINILDLTPGIHIVRLKLYSAGGTAYNELFEIWGVV